MNPLTTRTSTDAGTAGTFDGDDTLPRVPLPDLDASCERFVQWCAPLLTAEQLADTEAAVRADLQEGSVLRRMHAALVDYDARPEVRSWLDEFWRDRYLGRRDRIALNANFFFLLTDTGQGQLDRATALVDGLLAHKELLDAERLPPLDRRGQPLSMDQNRYLYAATRIPGVERDFARTPYSEAHPGPSTSRHIIVLHRERMARLDVLDDTGAPLPSDVICEALAQTRDTLANAPSWPQSLGAWTSMARADWAPTRDALLEAHPEAAEVLNQIEDALFCVVLDDQKPASITEAGDQLLAGNAHDRWFDKSLTFIVFGDGQAGINGEHCELDGTTIASMIDFLAEHDSASASQATDRMPVANVPVPQPLGLELSEREARSLEDAAADFAAYAQSMTSLTMVLPDLGSNAIKAIGVSPDAFVQAALQAANYQVRGSLGATYESIATRHWRAGRTEAMRVVTPEMVSFAEVMNDPSTSATQRRKALETAATAHVERARACQEGQVPEQHLWELQMLARRRGESKEPALHSSPGWQIMRDDRLSTSSVPSPHVQLFGFGATAPDCIGVAYALLPDRLSFYLSASRSQQETLTTFSEVLATLLREMITLGGDQS